jgi:3-oxoacyl-[acyl-carrier protein] reductase
LITGGSGRIGRALCAEFGRAGWNVGVHYRTAQAEAERTAALVLERGGQACCLQADIRDANEVQAMVEACRSRWGRLDLLICNAGTAGGGLLIKTSQEEWQRVVATNLTGTYHCLQAAGRVMVEQQGGAMLVVASYAALHGTVGQAAYAAAKAGLLGLVKSAAREWGHADIPINAVCPGWHESNLAGAALPDEEAMGALGVHGHVLGKLGDVESVARTIYHLALLPGASGQVWNLDSRIL